MPSFRHCSNNTNKLSPQEHFQRSIEDCKCSNNTNKLSPQEPNANAQASASVQIIQINLVLKNEFFLTSICSSVQIIQINLVLKNSIAPILFSSMFK